MQRQRNPQLGEGKYDEGCAPTDMGNQCPGEGNADGRGEPSHERQDGERLPAFAYEPIGYDGERDRVERKGHSQSHPTRPEQVELPEGIHTRESEQGETPQGRATTHEQARTPPVDEMPNWEPEQPRDDESEGVGTGSTRPSPVKG